MYESFEDRLKFRKKILVVDDELINRETEGVVRAQGMSGTAKVILGIVVVMAIAAAGLFFYRRLSAGNEE